MRTDALKKIYSSVCPIHFEQQLISRGGNFQFQVIADALIREVLSANRVVRPLVCLETLPKPFFLPWLLAPCSQKTQANALQGWIDRRDKFPIATALSGCPGA